MCQGRRSTGDYATDFCTLTISTGWNQQALYDVFFSELSEAIQDEFATWDPPSSFDEVVELLTRIDKRIMLRGAGREPPCLRTSCLENPCQLRPPPLGPCTQEQMKVDHTYLSPGKDKGSGT